MHPTHTQMMMKGQRLTGRFVKLLTNYRELPHFLSVFFPPLLPPLLCTLCFPVLIAPPPPLNRLKEVNCWRLLFHPVPCESRSQHGPGECLILHYPNSARLRVRQPPASQTCKRLRPPNIVQNVSRRHWCLHCRHHHLPTTRYSRDLCTQLLSR